MVSARDRGYQAGLLSFVRPTTLLRLTERLPTIAPRRLARTAGIAAGGWAGTPLQAYDWMRNQHLIDRVELAEDPVFIIGHWRSGTTHLHNLMSQDPQFGCLRMFEALAPDFTLSTSSWLPSVFKRLVPSKRPMDNMEWPMDAPQEEEIPLAKMTPYSWYLQFLFPQQAITTFDRYVLMNGAPQKARNEFKAKYLYLLRVASLQSGGRRLLLKNPVNTARVPLLLELFPNAKFVFIHRSPLEVFPSTINLHRKILELTALQTYSDDDIERNVIEIYRRVMQRYQLDAAAVPKGQLIEIGYDDVVRDPMGTLASVYDALDLDGFGEAQAPIQGHMATVSGYERNQFPELSDRVIELVEREWEVGFRTWGYPLPSGGRRGIDLRPEEAIRTAG